MRISPRASAASHVLAPVWPEVEIKARHSRREIVLRVEVGGEGMERSEGGCSRDWGRGDDGGGVIVYVTLLRDSGAKAGDVDESSIA